MSTHPHRTVRRPRNETLRAVIEYLESIDLNVYGACLQHDTWEPYEDWGGCMDYSADDVIAYRKVVDPV